MIWIVCKRFLRGLAYAYAARWAQKYGLSLPLEWTHGIADPASLSQAVNAGALLAADKGLRGRWSAISAWVSRLKG